MRLCLIRHALTGWNEEGRIQGHTDTELSPRGREQVRAWRLPAGFAEAPCITSPLRRARETAELLGFAVRSTDPRLREMHWGAFEGRRLAEIRLEGGAVMDELESRGLDFRPPGGESPREVSRRLAAFCADIAAEERDVLAVAHKGLLRAALVLACGWDMMGKPPVKFDPERALVLEIARGRTPKLDAVVDLRA